MKFAYTLPIVTALAFAAPIPLQAATTMAYYLTDGDSRVIHVVQGSSIIDTIPMTNNNRQYPIAVSTTVRTAGYISGDIGQEYQLDGTPTVSTYPLTGANSLTDGATNGIDANYAIAWNTGEIFVFDRDWNNATSLFTVGSSFGGITYDSSNASLWVNNRSTGETRNYSLSGSLLSSFTASTSVGWALAYEETSDSLWYISDNITGTLFNYSKDGVLLDQVAIPGLSGNILGGEMAIVPEPSSALLLGLAALFVGSRRRKK